MYTESFIDDNYMIMREKQCIIFITILTCCHALDLSCPGPGQWNFRATAYCNSDLNKYMCLLDTSLSRYKETCDGPRKEIEGLKSTTNRNNFDTTQCRTERYQIIDYTTVGNSDCVFQKSKCVQEGQITHAIKNESSLEDRKCMCDYTKGYSFINLPKDPCYCSPSVEDCSCYRELCPSRKQLSSDYQCATEFELENRPWKCPQIAFFDNRHKDDITLQNTDIMNVHLQNARRYRIAAIIPVVLMIFMIGLLIWSTTLVPNRIEEFRIYLVGTFFRNEDNSESSVTEMVFSTDIKSSLPINEPTAEKTSPAGSVKNEISADDDNTSFHSTVSRMDQSNENESHKSCSDGSAGANQISEDVTHMTSEVPVTQNENQGVESDVPKGNTTANTETTPVTQNENQGVESDVPKGNTTANTETTPVTQNDNQGVESDVPKGNTTAPVTQNEYQGVESDVPKGNTTANTETTPVTQNEYKCVESDVPKGNTTANTETTPVTQNEYHGVESDVPKGNITANTEATPVTQNENQGVESDVPKDNTTANTETTPVTQNESQGVESDVPKGNTTANTETMKNTTSVTKFPMISNNEHTPNVPEKALITETNFTDMLKELEQEKSRDTGDTEDMDANGSNT